MAGKYFQEFWIVAENGQTLHPARIKDQDTGTSRYQSLAKGSNKKADGRDTTDIVEALKWFMFYGRSLRFGNESTTDNRFEIDGGRIRSFGMAPHVWKLLA
jgi:hypothetical protein